MSLYSTFIIVRNPKEAKCDRIKRENIVSEVTRRLKEIKQMEGEPHKKATCNLRSHKTFGRYIRQTRTGKLCLDKAKIRIEEHLDGKYLLSTSDDGLPIEDVVVGYKQLVTIERVFRDIKHTIDIRPVYHRLSERIKAHVLLCRRAMLLIRTIEREMDKTWFQIKKIFSSIKLGIYELPWGTVTQSSKLNSEQKRLFKAVNVKLPPQYFNLKTPEIKK
jgi:transposase